jgi:SPP1 gp7 family putative phage head morphogenesis protein
LVDKDVMQRKMAKKAKTENNIVVNHITVGQLLRGNQTINSWISNVKQAERVENPNRIPLLNTYNDIGIDLHLESVEKKRIRAVKTTPFEWEDIDNDLIQQNFRAPWFSELLENIMSYVFKGHAVIEMVTGEVGLIEDVEMIPRQNVMAHKGLITKIAGQNGKEDVAYREGENLNWFLEVGKPRDLGLYAKLVPYVLMKRDNIADYSKFNEMFGQPLRKYEYDPHTPGAREQCVEQAESQGSAAYIVVPTGTGLTLVDGTDKIGSNTTYRDFHKVMNDEITIGVLGQILTTGGSDGGSYALGGVHKAVEEGINLEDRLMTEMILNYPFRRNILIPHGYPLDGVQGAFKLTEELPMAKKADIWLKIEDRMPVSKEDFYNEFGVPHPDEAAIKDWKERIAMRNTQPGGAENEPGKLISLRSRVIELYKGHNCNPYHKHKEIKLTLNKDELQRIIDELIERIYNGDVTAGDVDPNLYNLTAKEFDRALEAGYGLKLAEAAGADAAVLANLRENVYVFSGFKNYHMLREATDLLYDSKGAKRSFSAFKAEILKLNKDYNENFLRAEYQHAVGSSRMAGKWQRFEEEKETLPLLQYITAGDQRVRQSHRPLDGITLPVTHEFWNEYYPPNDWGCRCSVRQISDPDKRTDPTSYDQLPALKETFKNNSGKSKVIFPRNHPYYQVAPEDEGRAQNNFGLPKPGDDE